MPVVKQRADRRSCECGLPARASATAPQPAAAGRRLSSALIRRWRINLRTTSDLAELAEWMNPVILSWMNYYGKVYRTEMLALLRRINTYLVRWERRKFKRLAATRALEARFPAVGGYAYACKVCRISRHASTASAVACAHRRQWSW